MKHLDFEPEDSAVRLRRNQPLADVSHDFPETTLLVSGKVGKVIYSVRHGEVYRRKYVKPKQPDTAKQKQVQKFFGIASRMAKAAVLKSVSKKLVRQAKHRRAGGRIETKPSVRNAVISALFRGGIAVGRISEKDFRAMVIDGKPHTLKVMKSNGEKVAIKITQLGEIFELHLDATELQVNDAEVRYEVNKLNF